MLLGLLAVVSALASDTALKASYISSGGGTSSGGTYTMSGTVGQPVTLISSNGQYRLEPGFWAMMSVISTPEGPAIAFQRTGNQVVFTWSEPPGTYVLQKATTLGNAADWQNVSQTPVQVGEQNALSLELAPGNQFFRLRKVE